MAGSALAMVCPTCGGPHYAYMCPYTTGQPIADAASGEAAAAIKASTSMATASIVASMSMLDEGDTDMVIQVGGGTVQLPGSFVDDAAEGIDNLTDELGSESARRNERDELTRTSANRAKPTTRGNTTTSQEANASIATVNAMAEAGAGRISALVQGRRNSKARKHGGTGSSLPSHTRTPSCPPSLDNTHTQRELGRRCT